MDHPVLLTVEDAGAEGVRVLADGVKLLTLADEVGLDLADELTIVIEKKRRRDAA